MSKSFLTALFIVSLLWMSLLLVQLRTSSFQFVVDGSSMQSYGGSESVVGLDGCEELRSIRLEGEWGAGREGDTLEIRFAGFATGSKSTITGGYGWIHRRGHQELGRSSRSLALFWIFFLLVGIAPVIACGILLGRKLRRAPST